MGPTVVWGRRGKLKSQRKPLASLNQQLSVKTKGGTFLCAPPWAAHSKSLNTRNAACFPRDFPFPPRQTALDLPTLGGEPQKCPD